MIFVKKLKTKIGGHQIYKRDGGTSTRGRIKTSLSFAFPPKFKNTLCGMFAKASKDLSHHFSPIALPLTRRVFPQLFAMNTVGVQPMTVPSGSAFAHRFIYRNIFEMFNELV